MKYICIPFLPYTCFQILLILALKPSWRYKDTFYISITIIDSRNEVLIQLIQNALCSFFSVSLYGHVLVAEGQIWKQASLHNASSMRSFSQPVWIIISISLLLQMYLLHFICRFILISSTRIGNEVGTFLFKRKIYWGKYNDYRINYSYTLPIIFINDTNV